LSVLRRGNPSRRAASPLDHPARAWTERLVLELAELAGLANEVAYDGGPEEGSRGTGR
jgi:hypothetical protein